MEYTIPGFKRDPFLLTLTILPLNFKIGAFSKTFFFGQYFWTLVINLWCVDKEFLSSCQKFKIKMKEDI